MQPPGQGQGGVLIRGADGRLWFIGEGENERPRQLKDSAIVRNVDDMIEAEGGWRYGNYIPSQLADAWSKRRKGINWFGVFFVFIPPVRRPGT